MKRAVVLKSSERKGRANCHVTLRSKHPRIGILPLYALLTVSSSTVSPSCWSTRITISLARALKSLVLKSLLLAW